MAERKSTGEGISEFDLLFVKLIEQHTGLFENYMKLWLENGHITVVERELYQEAFEEYIKTFNETYLELKGKFSLYVALKKIPDNIWVNLVNRHLILWKSMQDSDPPVLSTGRDDHYLISD